MGQGILEILVDEAAAGGAAADADAALLEKKYRGVLLGIGAGNALGIPAEGQSRHAIRRHWRDRLTEVDPAERDRPWDDDLAQSALLAEALLRAEELKPDLLAHEFVEWKQRNGRGIGVLMSDVLAEVESGNPALDAARLVWERSGWSTAGNGAVMRCAPVALRWRASGTRLVQTAATSAAVTHYDLRCQWSTVVVYVVLAMVLSEVTPDLEQIAKGMEEVGGKDVQAAVLQQVVEAVRSVEGASLDDLELDDPMDMGYTLKAMRVALWSSHQGDDFEATVTDVVNAGGDTDTNGAVAGALVGARTGIDGIPHHWLENIPRTDELVALADRLLEASQ